MRSLPCYPGESSLEREAVPAFFNHEHRFPGGTEKGDPGSARFHRLAALSFPGKWCRGNPVRVRQNIFSYLEGLLHCPAGRGPVGDAVESAAPRTLKLALCGSGPSRRGREAVSGGLVQSRSARACGMRGKHRKTAEAGGAGYSHGTAAYPSRQWEASGGDPGRRSSRTSRFFSPVFIVRKSKDGRGLDSASPGCGPAPWPAEKPFSWRCRCLHAVRSGRSMILPGTSAGK